LPVFAVTGFALAWGRIGRANRENFDALQKSKANGYGGPNSTGDGTGAFRRIGISEKFDKYR